MRLLVTHALIKGTAAATLLLGIAFAAQAQQTANAPAASAVALDPTLPKALARGLQAGRGKLVATFKAAAGLTGYIVSNGPGRNEVLYGAPKSDVLIVGHLIDADGKDLNRGYVDQYGPKIDYSVFESRVVGAPAVVEGATGPAVKSTIYVFMDPNCIYCHLTWQALQPYEKIGLQVRWIPMGLLKPDSMGKSAALLESKDGAALMNTMETKFDIQHESAGIEAEADVSAATLAKITANQSLFHELGFFGTPTIFYRGKDGRLVPSQGMVRLSQLPAMTGLPPQDNQDPALARFQ